MNREEIITNIKDILIELVDIGFVVSVWSGKHLMVVIDKGDRKSWWSNNDRERDDEQTTFDDVIQHLNNYLVDLGYSLADTNCVDDSGIGNTISYRYIPIVSEKMKYLISYKLYEELDKEKYLKELDIKHRRGRRKRVKVKLTDSPSDKTYTFNSGASSPIPGPGYINPIKIS